MNHKTQQKHQEYQELEAMIINNMPHNISVNPEPFIINDYLRKAQNKGFTKPFGAKAKAYFKDKPQIINIGDGEYIIYTNPKLIRNRPLFQMTTVKEFKTPRGIHFKVHAEEHEELSITTVFSSHFLERLQERHDNQIKSREEAILKTLNIAFKDTYNNMQIIETEDEIIETSLELYLKEGLGLGKAFVHNGNVIKYIQTFVNLDMLFPSQKQRHAHHFQIKENSLIQKIA